MRRSLFHTHRFKDADGPRKMAPDGTTELPPELCTPNPHAALPIFIRTARAGKGMPDDVYEPVFGDHRLVESGVLDTPGAFPDEETTTIAHQWDYLSKHNHDTALTQAHGQGKMVYYVMAVDDEGQTRTLSPAERNVLRHAANPNNTGNRLGILPLFLGMPVEMSDKVSQQAGVLKAKRGVIESIIFGADEPRDFERDGSLERNRGAAVLEHFPDLLVRIDGFTEGQIPGRPDLLLVTRSASQSFKWNWKTTRGPSRAA